MSIATLAVAPGGRLPGSPWTRTGLYRPDPDDHHLFVSLGCAAENLVQAAPAMGLRGETGFQAGAAESLDVDLVRATEVRTPLFEAIPLRQSTRGEFNGRPLSNDELRLLETAGSGNGVRVHLLTDRQSMEQVLGLVVQGNTAQMRDANFVSELKKWLRFNGRQAANQGDGLFAGSAGLPACAVNTRQRLDLSACYIGRRQVRCAFVGPWQPAESRHLAAPDRRRSTRSAYLA